MTSVAVPAPSLSDIRTAAARIRPFIHRTPMITSRYLDDRFDAKFYFKCENFQKVGAFKARGATNAVQSLEEEERRSGVCTHSSGNHAQALSWAASLAGIPAYIVMPSNSSKVKVEAVRGYGGRITFCEPNLASRESTLAQVREQTGAVEIHPYNNLRIIAGQATAAMEMIEDEGEFDIIMAPVGGGGLLSGTALSTHYLTPATKIFAAEPEMADDAYRSFTSKSFIPSENPQTMADGLRTSLGSYTFPIILEHVSQIITVKEETIIEAMRMVWERMKVLIEPSSAVPIAAIIENPRIFNGKKTGIILSGGNVDLDHLPWIK